MPAQPAGGSVTPLQPRLTGIARREDYQEQAAAMQNQDMSDRDDSEEVIRNQDTVARRAWVAWALESVRRHLQTEDDAAPAEPPADRPALSVVRSAPKR